MSFLYRVYLRGHTSHQSFKDWITYHMKQTQNFDCSCNIYLFVYIYLHYWCFTPYSLNISLIRRHILSEESGHSLAEVHNHIRKLLQTLRKLSGREQPTMTWAETHSDCTGKRSLGHYAELAG